MALKNREQNLTYLRIKEGKFYIGKDTEKPFDELEGQITSLRYKDEEYEGKPIRKLLVVVTENGQNYQFGVGVETTSYCSLVGFLKNIDISRSLVLHPKEQPIEGSENKKRSILVSQEGKYAKGYFTKDTPNGLPKWDIVVVGKKNIADKTAYLDFLEEFVSKELVPKLGEPIPAKAAVNKVQNAEVEESPEEIEAEKEEVKLPWD